MKRWIITVLMAAGLFGGGYGVAQIKDKPVNKPAEVPQVTTSDTAKVKTRAEVTKTATEEYAKLKALPITMDRYNQLKKGMTYEQVVQILGGSGFKRGESKETGETAYIWKVEGNEKARVDITFHNGKLTDQAQRDLK